MTSDRDARESDVRTGRWVVCVCERSCVFVRGNLKKEKKRIEGEGGLASLRACLGRAGQR